MSLLVVRCLRPSGSFNSNGLCSIAAGKDAVVFSKHLLLFSSGGLHPAISQKYFDLQKHILVCPLFLFSLSPCVSQRTTYHFEQTQNREHVVIVNGTDFSAETRSCQRKLFFARVSASASLSASVSVSPLFAWLACFQEHIDNVLAHYKGANQVLGRLKEPLARDVLLTSIQ